ncbi:MAG: hypothetical protein AAFO69_14600 [Bacteroidota bacterium]
MIKKVELRKRRDFSENISTVFHIIRTEFKQFVGAVILIAGPLMLVVAILIAYLTLNAMNALAVLDPADESSTSLLLSRYVQMILSYIGLWFGYIFIRLVTWSYLKVYLSVRSAEEITTNMVWEVTKKNLFKTTVASIINLIVILISYFFFIIPGIVMGVYLSVVVPIMIIEEESYGSAFNKSFQYLTNNFWMTLGLTIVIGLIAYMISVAFSVPSIILTFVWQFNSVESINDGGANSLMGDTFSFLFLVSNIIATLARLMTFCIPGLSIGIHYYNLKEQRDSTGLMDQIAQMGQNIIVEDETY